MDRRMFIKVNAATVAVVGSGLVAGSSAFADDKNIGGGLRTKIAVSPNWFKGSHVEKIE